MAKTKRVTADSVLSVLCSAFVLLLCTVYLLFVPFLGYRNTTQVKYPVFLILCGTYVLLSCIILLSRFLVTLGDSKNAPVKPKRGVALYFSLAMLAYLLFTVLSSILSPYDGTWIGHFRKDGVLTTAVYVLSALLVARYFRPDRRILYAFFGAVSVFCIFSCFQLAGLNPLSLYPDGMTYHDGFIKYSGQYIGTIGNTDYCAAFLALACGAAEASLIRIRGKVRIGIGAVLFLTSFVLFEIDVQAGIAALLCGTACVLWLVPRSGEHLAGIPFVLSALCSSAAVSSALVFSSDGVSTVLGKRAWILLGAAAVFAGVGILLYRLLAGVRFSLKKYRITILILILLLLVAAFCFVYFYSGFSGGTLSELHQILHGYAEDTYGSGRIFIWRQTLQRVAQRPLFGGGPDTLSLRGLEPFRTYREDLGRELTRSIDAAHCEYLNILVNQGVFALLFYLAAIVIAAIAFLRSDSVAASIAGAGATFYLVNALFGISIFITTPFFFVSLGIVVGYINHGKNKE